MARCLHLVLWCLCNVTVDRCYLRKHAFRVFFQRRSHDILVTLVHSAANLWIHWGLMDQLTWLTVLWCVNIDWAGHVVNTWVETWALRVLSHEDIWWVASSCCHDLLLVATQTRRVAHLMTNNIHLLHPYALLVFLFLGYRIAQVWLLLGVWHVIITLSSMSSYFRV